MDLSDPDSLSPEHRQVMEAERKDPRGGERGENVTACVGNFTETNHESNTSKSASHSLEKLVQGEGKPAAK